MDTVVIYGFGAMLALVCSGGVAWLLWGSGQDSKIPELGFVATEASNRSEPEGLTLKKNRLTFTMGLLLSIGLMTVLGRLQDGRPILGGLVDANPEEAEALYTLYEDYREAERQGLACIALGQAVHAQMDAQKKTSWEQEFDTLLCDNLLGDRLSHRGFSVITQNTLKEVPWIRRARNPENRD